MASSAGTAAPSTHTVDEWTSAFIIDVDPAHVVLLQALLESYEGLATVRTLDAAQGRLCIFCPSDSEEDCEAFLNAVSIEIPWRDAQLTTSPTAEELIGAPSSE